MSDPLPRRPPYSDTGPFRASQIREGDPYELSNGHPIYCTPAGDHYASANQAVAMALGTDPAVSDTGVWHEVTLRNLLQRRGYESLEQVRSEGLQEGLNEARAAVLDLAEALGVKVTPKRRQQVAMAAAHDLQELRLALKKTRRWP